MKEQRKKEFGSSQSPRLWSHAEAVKAVPYLRAIVQSLREHWLETRQGRLQVQRIDARPGRPDRQTLISRFEANRHVESAEAKLEEVLNELTALGVYHLDPARGLALIPFRQGLDLAWFVFDLFAPEGLGSWRFHSDPLETRRPLEGNRISSPQVQLQVSRFDQVGQKTE